MARLHLISVPSGAAVQIGSRDLGRTPLADVELLPGAYEIAVEAPEHRPWRRTVTVEAGETRRLVAELRAFAATLHIVTQHQGQATWATVYLDGRSLGDTDSVRRAVEPGPHRVIARRAGYKEAESLVNISAGERKKVILVLEKD